MADPFVISVDMGSLDDIVDELTMAAEEAARPAAQAAAEVLYKEVKRNVASIGKKSGNLDRAIYQVFSKRDSGPGLASYYVSWNMTVAPHGHLIEYGHIQRYASYVGKDGQWYTAIRPEKQGTPKPKRRASQAEKDAYYVLRPGGPALIPPRSFVRAAESAFPAAIKAAEDELLKRIMKG
ncbi:MAG TPA: HK97 gp10 family phage protein [Noviherbaspirillum sp.]|nr:HK97 gp10 family phage protein [Noviherbaspirillum sp.]